MLNTPNARPRRRTRPIGEHAYTLPVVREIPPDPPDSLGAKSLW